MLSFEGCRLDLAGRVLMRSGQVQHLEPQAFDVLAHLLANRDRVVRKQELLDVVWGGQFVTESALTTRVKEIRRATGDDGEAQRVIRTVRGHGYRFVADVVDGPGSWSTHSEILGRERDLEELERRLAPGVVVTVVGPGGVGKTTLARAVVARAASRFPDGVVIVDLSVLDDPSRLLAVLARAAGIEDGSGSNLAQTLGGRDGLLLLDDADDLVAEVGALCSTLAGHLAIIVTCRERLGLRGEQLWPLLALDAVPARRLLVDRARALAPRGSLAGAGDDELDALGEAVDRLPLALEMLASMSAFLGVDALRDLVASRPDLITSPERGAPPRHRSLERLVDASVSRLGGPERAALLGLTAFAGPFSAQDGADVIGGDASMLLVGELVDRSLLASLDDPAGPRLQLLRTIANVAVLHADPAELHDASRRHAHLVTARLADADLDLRGEHEGRAREVFERLADEARAAHAWARAHEPATAIRLSAALHLYAYSRLWAEPSSWAQALLTDGVRSELVSAVLASQAAQEGRLLEALDLAEPLLGSEDVRVRGWALEVVSDVSIYLGDLDRALSASRALMDLGREHDEGRMLAIGVTNRGLALSYGGRAREALDLLDGEQSTWCLPIAPSERAWLAFTRGEALQILGDEGASGPLEEAAALGESVGNRFVAGVSRDTMAVMQRHRGDLRASATTYSRLLESFARTGNVTHLTSFLRGSVATLAELGERETALAVSTWLLEQRARPLWGPAEHALQVERESLGELVPGDEGDRCAALGLGLTLMTATTLALDALHRHSDPQDTIST